MNKPFLLRPSGKDYLWGGQRLKDDFGKDIDISPLAETWECSTHPDGPSYVSSGKFEGKTLAELIKSHPEFLGTKHAKRRELPILIKLIDAKNDLSVQVHPTDEYAKAHENGQMGKTEMWYVLDATSDARLVYGLNQDCDAETLKTAAQNGTLNDYLQCVPVKKNDVFFVEAGTIHALGGGVIVAEIQENSNITYRLYDYDRVEADGRKRPLHIEKAIEAANLKSSAEPRQPMRVLKYSPGAASELLCRCKYFEVYRLLLNTDRKQMISYKTNQLGFRVLLCINGFGTMSSGEENILFYKGDCVFVPADSEEITIHGKAQLLDVRA